MEVCFEFSSGSRFFGMLSVLFEVSVMSERFVLMDESDI